MDVEAFAKMLPEQAPRALLRWAGEQTDELGEAAYTSYRCEWVPREPTMQDLMDNRATRGKIRATVCECTECGQEWVTQKGKTAMSFFVVNGEDGQQVYPTGAEGDEYDPGLCYVEVTAGDEIACPYCGMPTKVIREQSIKGGRTKRLQVAHLLNVGRYTTILYWLVEREISPDGTSISAAPRCAYALDEKGRIKAFSHRRRRGMAPDIPAESWRPVKDTEDRWASIYSDWGSINGRKSGTMCWPEAPSLDEMEGTTGEKTGIARYWIDEGGDFGVTYLKAWRRFPALENVVNAGFSGLLHTILYDAACYRYDLATEMERMDTTKAKPHEILRISKADLHALGKDTTWEMLRILQRYRGVDPKTPLAEIGPDLWWGNGDTVIRQMEVYGGSLERYRGYMKKQGMRLGEIRTLADTRRTAQDLHPGTPLTEEELWPSHLQAAHDRLTAQAALAKSREKTEKLQAGFDAVLEKYAGIQWTDGRLAVILPRSNDDLVREGAVLRHCVGGYGSRHAGGKEIILFIRHYRRPERSYYTLNIGLDRGKPYEIQLHGYGNERHGPHKEYAHTIPKEVRAFVDRWEREVLLPWAAKQGKKKKEDKAA